MLPIPRRTLIGVVAYSIISLAGRVPRGLQGVLCHFEESIIDWPEYEHVPQKLLKAILRRHLFSQGTVRAWTEPGHEFLRQSNHYIQLDELEILILAKARSEAQQLSEATVDYVPGQKQ
jgi:hypothetical protein